MNTYSTSLRYVIVQYLLPSAARCSPHERVYLLRCIDLQVRHKSNSLDRQVTNIVETAGSLQTSSAIHIPNNNSVTTLARELENL